MPETSSFLVYSSPYSTQETIDNLKKHLQAKGVTVFAVIDHAQAAKNASLELAEEQVIIFGDPKTGTFLMQENPEIGIELPLKILVWKNADGSTQIGYKDPILLADIYGIKTNIEILKKMSQGLAGLISQVVL